MKVANQECALYPLIRALNGSPSRGVCVALNHKGLTAAGSFYTSIVKVIYTVTQSGEHKP